MTRTTLAVAADYADAMLVARRWKNVLFLVLLLMLLIQIGAFVAVRFYGGGSVTVTAGSPDTTQPAIQTTRDLAPAVAWLTNFVDFLSMVCVVVLAVVLLLVVIIMLVGRLIGVAHVTSAFIMCVILAMLMFPWQSLWNYPLADTAQTAPDPIERLGIGPRFGLPGVLYTWPELEHKVHFGQSDRVESANQPNNARWSTLVMGWARFVGWPVVAIVLLLKVQAASGRGLKFALGESEVQVETTAAPPGV
jgi:hypothetical protein